MIMFMLGSSEGGGRTGVQDTTTPDIFRGMVTRGSDSPIPPKFSEVVYMDPTFEPLIIIIIS
jgi:hypothetical protein